MAVLFIMKIYAFNIEEIPLRDKINYVFQDNSARHCLLNLTTQHLELTQIALCSNRQNAYVFMYL